MTRAQPLRAVFMGTPDFAARILETLLDSGVAEVVAVYSQPDRPAGRGKALKAPEVKVLAEARGIPVFQPLNFREAADVEALAALKPDILVVAAYGLILPQRVLNVPRLMPVNVHASILPKYRGAAPIQRALMNGDKFTGNTIMRMEAGMDTGPILMQSLVNISEDDTSATMHDKLATDGGYLLVRALEMLQAGELPAQAQDEERATMAPKLSKGEGWLDFNRPCAELHNLMRGLTPWPGANFSFRRAGAEDLVVTAQPGRAYPADRHEAFLAEAFKLHGLARECGRIQGMYDDHLLVACADGWYGLKGVKPSGGKLMDARAFYNGYVKGREDAAFVPGSS